MKRNIVTLDVREDIRRGREPFSRIMSAVAGLAAGQQLLVIAPFEPVPLFAVLANQGFGHEARSTDAGDWEVLFTRTEEAGSTGKGARKGKTATSKEPPVPPLEVDARGLEPPQPLARILEALEHLPRRAELHALTDRRPIHLYPRLEERGYAAETEERPDGSFITYVRPR